MELDPEDLRRHYAMLSDEALVALDRSELVEVAQHIYDQELRKRRLTLEPGEDQPAHGDLDGFVGPKPAWLNDAACAIAFDTFPGHETTADAVNARTALEAAGIPCYIDLRKVDPPSVIPQPQYVYSIMVPGKFNLQAVSALDQAIYNPEMEREYRVHFESLSDEELRAVKPEVLLAGLSDRIERLTRAYNEEMERRRTA